MISALKIPAKNNQTHRHTTKWHPLSQNLKHQ